VNYFREDSAGARASRRSAIVLGAVVGFLVLGACYRLTYIGDCGTYAEIGEIYCDDGGPEVCLTHPWKIVWPTPIHQCQTTRLRPKSHYVAKRR
jgi:hypothetical protein